jgi:hypothetical protein
VVVIKVVALKQKKNHGVKLDADRTEFDSSTLWAVYDYPMSSTNVGGLWAVAENTNC